MSAPARDLSPRAAWALLAVAVLVHYGALMPFLRMPVHEFDALHMYLPAARALLEQGPAFFLQERSVYAPPMAFLWPALAGPGGEQVKLANALLSGLTLLLAFRTGTLLHSRAAGALAALLFAANPLMRPYLAAAITEGPYLFACALWLWGLAEWIVGGRRWALAASAAGLALAALTRAPMFYWGVLLLAAAALAAWRLRGTERPPWLLPLAAAYAIALVPPLAFSAKNYALFGFPSFATGGGNALYQGNNPLTGGYDSGYLGLIHDVGAIARDQPHLGIEAERLLGRAARLVLEDHDAAFFVKLHARKLAAFVFVTNAEDDVAWQRSWRIALLVLAAFGFAAIANPWLRGALLGVLLFQVAIHVPVLYVHRYSVGAMDLWLVLAAGVGLAGLGWASWRRRAVAAAAVAGGIVLGLVAFEKAGRPMPDVFAAARTRVWQGGEGRVGDPRAPLEIAVENGSWTLGNHVLVLELARGDGGEGCGRLAVAYRPRGSPAWHEAPLLRLRGDGKVRRYQLGGVPLHLGRDGTLRLALACAAPGSVAVRSAAVYAALGAFDYHDRLRGKPPMYRMER